MNQDLSLTTTSLAIEGAILVIDDEAATRNALTDVFGILTEAAVYTAANGHEGLQILPQLPRIALVILDLNMPVMNGEQTYERLQEVAPEAKVIVASSLSKAEAKLRFGERPLPAFLQKPYDINGLLQVVQSVSATG